MWAVVLEKVKPVGVLYKANLMQFGQKGTTKKSKKAQKTRKTDGVGGSVLQYERGPSLHTTRACVTGENRKGSGYEMGACIFVFALGVSM